MRQEPTGTDGSFSCEGLAPLSQPIVAWADGCTRAQEYVQCVAGQAVMVTLVLVRGVTVKGTARNQAGEVMADVVVRSPAPADRSEDMGTLMYESPRFKRPHTRTDASGRFVLRGIPPGDLHLVAGMPRNPVHPDFQYEAFCQVSLVGRAGEELTWDPVLIAGKTIRVRVVDADGKHTWFSGISAIAEEPAGPASVLSSGPPQRPPACSYTFVGCADVPYTICGTIDEFGSEPRHVYRTGVRPGGPEVEIQLPPVPPPGEPGQITGRIVDGWQRLAGMPMAPRLYSHGSSLDLRVDGDRFFGKDVRPGRYYISASDDRGTILLSAPFDLQAGQHLDLGDLATEPGARVRVVLRVPTGADVDKPYVALGGRSGWWRMRWDGTQLIADNVTVGRHRYELGTAGWHAPPGEVDVVAGQDNVVMLDLVPATRRRLDVVLPLPDQWQRCELTLRAGSGKVVARTDFEVGYRGVAPFRWQEYVPLGLFTLEAVLDGQKRTWPLDLRDPATGDRPLRFSLR